jgi:hypothetical protein
MIALNGGYTADMCEAEIANPTRAAPGGCRHPVRGADLTRRHGNTAAELVMTWAQARRPIIWSAALQPLRQAA